MEAKTQPRAGSRLMPPQLLVPPVVFHESPSQVSLPNWPGRGVVWKIQRRFPVAASYPRMWPGASG